MGVITIFIGAIFIYFFMELLYKNSQNVLLAEISSYFFAWYVFICGIYAHIHFKKFTFMKRKTAFILSVLILISVYFSKIQNTFNFEMGGAFLISFLLTLMPIITMLSLYFHKTQAK